MKERVLIKNINASILNKHVILAGWAERIRILGQIAFIIIRDGTGLIQCVIEGDLIKKLEGCLEETVIKVKGVVQKSKSNINEYEVLAQDLEIISKVTEQVPIQINVENLNAHLDTILDYRSIALRHKKLQSIFKIQAGILKSFREAMDNEGFIEFRSPVLIATPSESGASVFEVNYYGQKAYLAQSPQIYKQIMVGVFERVYTISPVFRAEKHNTSRHIMEITQMDAEVGFIEDYNEVLEIIERVIKHILFKIDKDYRKELDILEADLPKISPNGIPKLKVKEALKIIEEETGKSSIREELDVDPEDERIISKWVKQKYNSDFFWLLNFKKDKNFYTENDPENNEESLSFDLECRGLELLSGTKRIHNYNKLVESIKKNRLTMEYYDQYLQAFKYGMPYEAGFSFGLERLTQQLIGLKNIKEATLFPSDLDRIASQKISKTKNLKRSSKL